MLPASRASKGWLTIYHGVRHTASGSIYRLGLAFFEVERPDVHLQRGESWIFGPEDPYERTGDVNDIVFRRGQTIDADGDTINLYYGAADSCIALATGSISSLLAWAASESKLGRWRGAVMLTVVSQKEGSRECYNCNLAELVAARALVPARLPLLQLGPIQTC